MEALVEKYMWIAVMIVFLVEHLIAASKLKSNSAIELVLNIIKFVFGMDNKEELELPKK